MFTMNKMETIRSLASKGLVEFYEKIRETAKEDKVIYDSIGSKQREADVKADNEIL